MKDNIFMLIDFLKNHKVLVIITIVIFFMIWTQINISKNKKAYKDSIKNDYFKALKGTNKQLALELGRKYYESLHENGYGNSVYTNIMIAADEQKLANDISTMKTSNVFSDDETFT